LYIDNCRGREAKKFKSLQIENWPTLGLLPLSQIREFLSCASLQIAKPQIFMIKNNAQLFLKTVLKAVFLTQLFDFEQNLIIEH
jgi:hypothetical protein